MYVHACEYVCVYTMYMYMYQLTMVCLSIICVDERWNDIRLWVVACKLHTCTYMYMYNIHGHTQSVQLSHIQCVICDGQ